MDTIAVIGSEDQPIEYQLGEPIGVVTDQERNIYIADRASLTVKVFDPEGKYLRSFGGRGRGPGEFQYINMMRPAGGDTLVFQDRGKLEFIYMTTQGEFISSYPVDLSSQMAQYYPESVEWHNGYSIGLMQKASFPRFDPPPMERPLFYVYDREFQERRATFFPFNQLEYTEDEMFVWSSFIYFAGSFDLFSGNNKLIYSPGVYTGKLYEFVPSDSLRWALHRTITAQPSHSPPYEIYHSEAEYEAKREISGVNMIRFSGTPFWGRLYSIDAGIFHLENGNIVHFYGEWGAGDTTLDEGNVLELFVQILNQKGELLKHGMMTQIEQDLQPSVQLVNWKDEEDNFYLLNLSKDDVPTVIKFRLNLDDV